MKYISPKYELTHIESEDILTLSSNVFEITKTDAGEGKLKLDFSKLLFWHRLTQKPYRVKSIRLFPLLKNYKKPFGIATCFCMYKKQPLHTECVLEWKFCLMLWLITNTPKPLENSGFNFCFEGVLRKVQVSL